MVAASKPLVERFGSLNLPLGGTNGYVGVRKCKKGGFQGYTPQKSKGHFTGRYETAQEAAVARAIKQQEIALGFNCDSGEEPRRQRANAAAAPWRHVLASRARLSVSLSFVESCLRKEAATQPKPKALKFQTALDSPLTGIPPLRAAPRVSPAPLGPLVPTRLLTFEQAALLLALGSKRVQAMPMPLA